MREIPLSTCEKRFILEAAVQQKRLDGRKLEEFRSFKIHFGNLWGSCLAALGDTLVMAQVSCEVQEPKTTRPNEGMLFINVELSQMAAAHFEPGRGSDLSVHLNRLLEKCIKDSKAVDLESLCIVSEEKVWILRVDVNVLNHDGNLADCASIAALAAISHFRRPDVTTDGHQITVHDVKERDPIPITLHHYPVCVSYALFNSGQSLLADPTAIEERVADANLVFGVNAYGELCGLHMSGTALASTQLILKYSTKAAKRARDIVTSIKEALLQDIEMRKTMASSEVGFSQIDIMLDKITSMSLDRIKIKLKKFNMKESGEYMDVDDNKPSVVTMEADANGAEEEEDKDKPEVIQLGDNSATLLPPLQKKKKKNIPNVITMEDEKYGDGGSSKWGISKTSVTLDVSDDEDVTVIPTPVKSKPVENIAELSGDSEEETVHILKGSELNEGKAKQVPAVTSQKNKSKPRKRRNK